MTLLDPATRPLPLPSDPPTPTAWIDVCALADLEVDRGVGALIDGRPVALFRCSPWDELFAIGNIDPYSSASVLSRGIVGSVGHRPVVASPVFKNRFDLHTGASVDDPAVAVPVYPIRTVGGRVQVAARHP